MAKKITTVLGDIRPEDLGYTSIHEHTLLSMAHTSQGGEKKELTLHSRSSLLADSSFTQTQDQLCYDDVDAEVEELLAFKSLGGQSLMDCSYTGCRLDIRDIRTLSERSGVNIVVCSGFLGDHAYPFDPMDRKAVRKYLIRQLSEGIDETDIKPGCLKTGMSYKDFFMGGQMPEQELSVFRAICETVAETGYPVAIHCSFMRENLLKMLDIALNECGVSPQQIDICHLDLFINSKSEYPELRTLLRDPGKAYSNFTDFACRVLDTGVYANFDNWGSINVGNLYDRFFWWQVDDMTRLTALIPLLEKGYASQLMFGHDKAGGVCNYYRGGLGYTTFPRMAVSALKEIGFEKEVHQIVIDNPARFLSRA